MERFDPRAEEEKLFELISRINKINKKRISRIKQLLKKNNLSNREAVRILVRQAKTRNDNLYSNCHSLHKLLKQTESDMDLHL